LKLLEISNQGLDIAISSNVPIGGGLSSSAALECSVGAATNQLLGLGHEKLELARICQRAENEVVGAPTGNMDQIASLFGKADNAVFIDCRSEEIELVDLGFEKAGLEIVVIDTKTSHKLDDGDYGNRRDECYSAAEKAGVNSLRELSTDALEGIQSRLTETEFKRAKHIVTENQRVLDAAEAIKNQDYYSFGKLMTASHASMRDDFEISTIELDQAVEASLVSGAFGGSAIALIESKNFPQLKDNVLEAFKSQGFENPEIFGVKPSFGAREVKGTD
jgi:galactokinase